MRLLLKPLAILFLISSSPLQSREVSITETWTFIGDQFRSADASIVGPESLANKKMSIAYLNPKFEQGLKGYSRPDWAEDDECTAWMMLSGGNKYLVLQINASNLSQISSAKFEKSYAPQDVEWEGKVVDLRGAISVFKVSSRSLSYEDKTNEIQFLLDSSTRGKRVRNAFDHIIASCKEDDLPF